MNVTMTSTMRHTLFTLRPRVRKGQAGCIERDLHNRLETARLYLQRRTKRQYTITDEGPDLRWWAPLV